MFLHFIILYDKVSIFPRVEYKDIFWKNEAFNVTLPCKNCNDSRVILSYVFLFGDVTSSPFSLIRCRYYAIVTFLTESLEVNVKISRKKGKTKKKTRFLVWFMVLNATFNNISVISLQSILLVEETRGLGENHRPVASH